MFILPEIRKYTCPPSVDGTWWGNVRKIWKNNMKKCAENMKKSQEYDKICDPPRHKGPNGQKLKMELVTCLSRWKDMLPRKNIEKKKKKIRLPTLISAMLKMDEKFKCAKVVQKCPNFFSVFYDHTWAPGPICKSYSSFFSWRGVKGSTTAIITCFLRFVSPGMICKIGLKMPKFF